MQILKVISLLLDYPTEALQEAATNSSRLSPPPGKSARNSAPRCCSCWIRWPLAI